MRHSIALLKEPHGATGERLRTSLEQISGIDQDRDLIRVPHSSSPFEVSRDSREQLERHQTSQGERD